MRTRDIFAADYEAHALRPYSGLSEVGFDGVAVNPVPEPSTAILLGIGFVGMAGLVRKRK